MLSLITLASIASIATAANVAEFKNWLLTLDSEVFVTAEPTQVVSFLYDLGMLEDAETLPYASVYSKVYESYSGIVPVTATQDVEDIFASEATGSAKEEAKDEATKSESKAEPTNLDPSVPVQLTNGGHHVAVPVACMAAAGVAMM